MSSNTMISLRPKHVIQHLPWSLGSKSALGFILILAMFSLVGWLYLTNASTVTATSYRVDELRMELDHIKNQNANLILEISELEALARVEARAKELGYQPTTNVQYVAVENYPVSAAPRERELRVENSVNAYVDRLEGPAWWLEALDAMAAWLAGEANSSSDPSSMGIDVSE